MSPALVHTDESVKGFGDWAGVSTLLKRDDREPRGEDPFYQDTPSVAASQPPELSEDGGKSSPISQENGARPLCVDLDGTLIRSDLLQESLLLLVKRNPLYLLSLPAWFLRGAAVLKAEVALRVTVQAEVLPYNHEVIRWLETERDAGRPLCLCSASNQCLADQVARHLGLFDQVLASNRRTNLSGMAKAASLVQHFGERGFDYCGSKRRDLDVWRRAQGAILVGAGPALQRDTARSTRVLRTFPAEAGRWPGLFRALRPHQWTKNVLLLAPMLAAHRWDARAITHGLLAFIVFCLCSSSVYVLNDLLDLQADRVHPWKSARPFATGDLSILTGLGLVPVLLILAAIGASLQPEEFAVGLAMYFTLTLLYSTALKRSMIIDVVLLAALYTLRIIAGAAAVQVSVSFWLLLLSVFLFLSLAFVKRFAELRALRSARRMHAAGRAYDLEDLPILQSFGISAGYLSVVVLALYINSPSVEALYRRPKVIWLLCALLLYWVSRVWMQAQRGRMHEDPVVFALRDPVSLVVGLLAAVTILAAI
jgi:4-hydroxybenzoate polyprenyltransferase/phosphoserine phosphatase